MCLDEAILVAISLSPSDLSLFSVGVFNSSFTICLFSCYLCVFSPVFICFPSLPHPSHVWLSTRVFNHHITVETSHRVLEVQRKSTFSVQIKHKTLQRLCSSSPAVIHDNPPLPQIQLSQFPLFKASHPVVYGMLIPPRLMLSQPTMNSVEKQRRETPLQIMASLADSQAPSFNFLMM